MTAFGTYLRVTTLTTLAFGTALPAYAQLPADANNAAVGQASPARIESQIDRQDIVRGDFSPRVAIKSLVLQKAPPNAENIKLTLRGVQLEGMGVYTDEQVQAVFADKLGENITLADVYAISSDLTNKYRNDGYILTQVIVPPQTIENGIIKLRAVEGFIDQIRVEGQDQESALKTIRGYAAHLRSEKALNVEDLEKFLLLINDLPGVSARSVLSPSETRTGASDLRLIIERDPYEAFVGIDNFGTRYLGPWQLTGGGALNSYFGNNERITAQTVWGYDSGRELAFFNIGYKQPINTLGTTVETTYSHSNTKPGFDLRRFEVKGVSHFLTAKIEHPFIRTRTKNFYGHAQFDWRDVDSRNILERTREDRIRTIRVGGRYDFLDSFINVGINSINVEVAQGLDVMGASTQSDLFTTRPGADPAFLKLNAQVERLQRVTSKLNLLTHVRGQWASQALLSSEEFGVGGIGLGRGYDPSEIVGDDGIAGKVELQWNRPYNLNNFFQDYQLFGFYDIGKVWNEDATSSADKKQSIASTGAGIRADFKDNTKAGFAVALPLTKDVDTMDDKTPRFYFNLSRGF